jgi:hypothetical protein
VTLVNCPLMRHLGKACAGGCTSATYLGYLGKMVIVKKVFYYSTKLPEFSA